MVIDGYKVRVRSRIVHTDSGTRMEFLIDDQPPIFLVAGDTFSLTFKVEHSSEKIAALEAMLGSAQKSKAPKARPAAPEETPEEREQHLKLYMENTGNCPMCEADMDRTSEHERDSSNDWNFCPKCGWGCYDFEGRAFRGGDGTG